MGTSGSYNVRLVATSSAAGALCPNAGNADITFTARLDVWVAQILQDGTFDPGFGVNGEAEINGGSGDGLGLGIAVQQDEKLVVVGAASERAVVARLCGP